MVIYIVKFRLLLIVALSLGINGLLFAQNEVIPLWTAKIPGSIQVQNYDEIETYKDEKLQNIRQITTPTLSVFLPEKENHNGTAVIVFPGGGYFYLTMDKEGYKVARWLNTLGITAVVLKYRLPSDAIMTDKTIGPLQDAQEAVRAVRRNADKWKVDINKIGIIGFSAGGHLAAALSTRYLDNLYNPTDTVSARPNFSMLIYPVISMKEGIKHQGSRGNLLGKTPSDLLINKFSMETQVNNLTPPTFMAHASDDASVPVENSILYYQALIKHKVPAELHLYEKGGHGFGLGVKETSQFWTKQAENWLRSHHYI
ncbi:MAG TPA: alpha/beta hydrolase, partial [Lutibacter sp.]|nr:alpha/beta hydrolase [Lutibacter sp.]